MTIKLVQTCFACPEQYDAYEANGSYLGYLRLRHGNFCAEYNGDTVYRAHTDGDGIFEENERDPQLRAALSALLQAKSGAVVGADAISYVIVSDD